MSVITPTFAGEMQLAGWSESHTGGCKVTFWLPSPDDLAVFRTLTTRKGNTAGHRFMAALVEIGDDETPVQPNIQSYSEKDISQKPKGGPLSKLAGMWCNDPEFYAWIRPVYDVVMGGSGHGCGDVSPDDFAKGIPEYCRHCILVMCDITSRADLDHDAQAAERFNRLIRTPYSKHLIARGIVR